METTLETIIEHGKPREIRRALAVKMSLSGIETKKIVELMGVSDKFVSKWKLRNEREGSAALLLHYKGSKGFLQEEERAEIRRFISDQNTFTVEEVVKYVKERYGVVYQSKQSYYELLKAGRMSWHKSQKGNSSRDESKIQAKREEIKKNSVKEAKK